jgi:hypothetical protein
MRKIDAKGAKNQIGKDPVAGYMIGSSGIRALLAVAEGKNGIASISREARLSIPQAYAIAARLEKIGFLSIEKEGRAAKLSFSDSRHSQSFQKLAVSRELDLEKALRDSNLRILFSIMLVPKDKKRIAGETRLKEESVRKYARILLNAGILYEKSGKLGLSPTLPHLLEFLEDYSSLINGRIARSLCKNATVAWEHGLEAVVRVPIGEKIDAQETAITAMSGRGIQIMTDYGYYFIPAERKLRTEDVALHTILIDRSSTRYVSYALLLLKKEGFERKYLLEKGTEYGIRSIAEDMAGFLSGKEIKSRPMPSREEFNGLCGLYGVEP